ncbi:hypothetical protein G6F59_018911 [Rhizopus arrhizus]|nr:hypothetical protein G6F59_018911 [Rhizopus arrhizus]
MAWAPVLHVLRLHFGLRADPGLAGASHARHGRAPGRRSADPFRAHARHAAKLARGGGAGSPRGSRERYRHGNGAARSVGGAHTGGR